MFTTKPIREGTTDSDQSLDQMINRIWSKVVKKCISYLQKVKYLNKHFLEFVMFPSDGITSIAPGFSP